MVVALLGISCCLCTCRSLPAGEGYRQPKRVYVTNDLAIPLLDTALLDRSLDFSQRVKGSYGGKVYFLDVFAKADAEGIDMVGLNSLGTEVMDISYSKVKGIRLASKLGGSRFKPEYVVADFQIAYYPFEAVRAALEPYGLDFELRGDEGHETRVLSRGGKAILSVERLPEGLRIVNSLRGYSYELRENG
jgi:hypothetical protein